MRSFVALILAAALASSAQAAGPFHGYPIGGGPVGAVENLQLVDLNGDARLDLLLGMNVEAPRFVLNTSSGTPFAGAAAQTVDGTSGQRAGAHAADLDGDLDADLVIAVFNAPDQYLLSAGGAAPFTGTTASALGTANDSTTAVLSADFDGDGDRDVVTLNTNVQSALLYLNNGSATPFAGVAGAAVGAELLYSYDGEAADFDGDGDIDLVLASVYLNGVPGNLVYYANNGTASPFAGAVGVPVFASGHYLSNVAVGDLDGDGDLDLVGLTDEQSDQADAARIVLNSGTSAPWGMGSQVIPIPQGAAPRGYLGDAVIADLDGDGERDIAFTIDASDSVVVWLNVPGAAILSLNRQHVFGPAVSSLSSIAAGDVDGDGRVELVIAPQFSVRPYYFEYDPSAGGDDEGGGGGGGVGLPYLLALGAALAALRTVRRRSGAWT